MDRSFQHIATVSLIHEYFSDGVCSSFNFEIPVETRRICMNLNLVIKAFENGLYILCNTPELLENHTFPLRFQLKLMQSSFWNYTGFPEFNPGEFLLYFNNLAQHEVDDAGIIPLHQEKYATGNNLAKVCAGRLTFGTFSQEEEINVVDAWGDSQGTGKRDSLDFRPIAPGFFELRGESNHLPCFFYPQTIFRKPAGIIEIFPSALFENIQPSDPVHYKIQFKSIRTRWRYILADPVYAKYQHLYITDDKKNANIFKEKKLEIKGLENFKCFESLDPIPLNQSRNGYFQLLNSNNNNGRQVKILIKRLPQASPESVYQERTSIRELYSHIFI